MDTSLLLQLDGIWKEVDLYEDLPISVVIQETDLTDFQGRKSPYSKQFAVPGTMNNGLIFEHYYEANGIEFDPLVKIPCVVQYRGTDIFNGVCRLQSVITTDGYVEYEVYIMGDVADFISEIKDLTLRDLNWEDLQHELTYDNVVLSWNADETDTNGLFGGKVIYPMINWGLEYGTGTTPTFSFDFTGSTSFTGSSHPIPPSYFKPAVRMYEVVKRLFNQTSYQVQSNFFESEYFKSIYMDTFTNGKLGIEVASGVSNQNLFVVQTTNKTFEYEGDGLVRNMMFNDNIPGSSDPLNDFTNTNIGVFKIPYAGDYFFNARMNYESHDITQTDGDIAVIVKTGTSPTNLTTQIYEGTHYQIGIRGIFPPELQKGSINEFFGITNAPAGIYVGVFIKEFDDFGRIPLSYSNPRGVYNITPFNSGGVVDNYIRWDLYNSPTLAGTQLVDLKLGIADMSCEDFLRAIITMFNLIIVQDEPNKTILIEPYNSYYDENKRVERDWTEKLDLTSSYKLEPLSFDLSKELQFTYTKGSDEYLNKLFEDQYNYNFGRYKYTSTSNILTNTQVYEIPFAALPSQVLPGSTNFIIPMVYKEIITETSISQSPYSSKPHIFFWCGNRYAYVDKDKQQPSLWYMLSGTTAVSQTTYPCVSHLSSLDISNPNYVSDLSFGSSFDFFMNSNPYPVQSSPYTLFNTFWGDYISNTYSNETKRFNGKFYLEPIEIYETKLTDKIFVKDSFYRIEKINEGNLIEPQFTDVSLIKERGGYYNIQPPAPYYFTSPNQSYPTFYYPVGIPSYFGLNKSDVCSGTTGTGLVYQSGVPPFADGNLVYSFNGTSYVPLQYGTYVRWTGSTDTYVVINNTGQILQTDC